MALTDGEADGDDGRELTEKGQRGRRRGDGNGRPLLAVS